MNKNFKTIIFTILIAIIATFSDGLWSKSSKDLIYKWKNIRGARGYVIQIKNEKGKLIFNKTTRGNSTSLKLLPGIYNHRIAALNKFRRRSRWTNWVSLIIEKSISPRIKRIAMGKIMYKKAPLEKGATKDKIIKQRTLQIKGENFLKETRFRLTKDGHDIRIISSRVVDKNTIEAVVDVSKVKSKPYDLIVENPADKIVKKPELIALNLPGKKVIIVPQEKPELKIRTGKDPMVSKKGGQKTGEKTIAANKGKQKTGDKSVATNNGKQTKNIATLIKKKETLPDDKKKSLLVKKIAQKKVEKKTDAKSRTSIWEPLLPGWPALKRNEIRSGLTWIGIFSAYAVAGFAEWSAANSVALQRESNLLIPLFTDENLFLSFDKLALPLSNSEKLTLGLLALNQDRTLTLSYNQHQQNQAIIGGAVLFTYLIHVYSETPYGWNWKKSVPGLLHITRGELLPGFAWLGLFTGLAAAGLVEYNNGNKVVREARDDFITSSLKSPILVNQLRNGLFSSLDDQALLLTAFHYQELDKNSEARYQQHRTNQGIIGGAAFVLYVAHLLHSTAGGPGRKVSSQVKTGIQTASLFLDITPDRYGKVILKTGLSFYF